MDKARKPDPMLPTLVALAKAMEACNADPRCSDQRGLYGDCWDATRLLFMLLGGDDISWDAWCMTCDPTIIAQCAVNTAEIRLVERTLDEVNAQIVRWYESLDRAEQQPPNQWTTMYRARIASGEALLGDLNNELRELGG